MYLAHLAYANNERPCRTTWLAVALGLALVGLYITRVIDPYDYVKITNEGVVRGNLEEGARLTYLGFFFTEDLIIGIIPLTILALASMIAILLPTSKVGVALALAATGIAAYVNFSVVTRTTLVSCGIAIALVAWLNRSEIRLVAVKRLAALACVLLVASAGFFFVVRKPVVQNAVAHVDAMAQRMDKANEDGRLDHWLEAVQRIAERPEGDARILMTSQYWAHNLFLDSALSTGLLGMLSIVAVFTLPLVRLYRVIAAGRLAASPLFQIVCAQFLAVWIAAQISPPNLAYFVFTMIATGFIYCLPHE
jgi:O-antigen ligase